jgi:DNA-binding XRE family transcriptional regulator
MTKKIPPWEQRPAPERDRIKLVRAILGLKNSEIGKQLGIDGKTWNSYERGFPVPRRTVWALKDKFDLSPEWVWYGAEGNLTKQWRNWIREIEKLYKELHAAEAELERTRENYKKVMRKKISTPGDTA